MAAEGFQATEKFTDEEWDNTSTEAPPPLPSAIYNGRIVSADYSMGAKNPQVKLVVEFSSVRGGESLKAARKVTEFITITGATKWKVKQWSVAANVKNPADNGSEALGDWCAALLGSDVIAKVRQDSFLRGDEKIPTNRIDRPLSAAEADQAQGTAAATQSQQGGSRRQRGG